MKYIIVTTITGTLLFFSSCGGAAKKEKARQESIKKAEEEAKQKAEQDKKQAWQDLLNACKDEEKNKLVTYGENYKDVEKQQVRHLTHQNKLNEKANKFATYGKRKIDSGYLICVGEYSNEQEETYDGKPTKIYDMDKWLFSTDEQGNILDAIKIAKFPAKTDVDKSTDVLYETILTEGKKFILQIDKGVEKDMTFTGERIRYKVENGKFVEISRKKEKHETGGC
jgi:hypothetical protein